MEVRLMPDIGSPIWNQEAYLQSTDHANDVVTDTPKTTTFDDHPGYDIGDLACNYSLFPQGFIEPGGPLSAAIGAGD
jgi:hypothetical protein